MRSLGTSIEVGMVRSEEESEGDSEGPSYCYEIPYLNVR